MVNTLVHKLCVHYFSLVKTNSNRGQNFLFKGYKSIYIYSQIALKVLQSLVEFIKKKKKKIGEGNGNPLQYSCLENPKESRAKQATVHRITESGMTEATRQAQTLVLKMAVMKLYAGQE